MRNVVLPTFIVGAVGLGLIFGSARSPKIALAFTWMLVPLLPALDLRAFIEGHLVHDRYLYLPSFGFAMLVALGIRHLNVGSRLLGQPALQLGIAGVLALAMGMEIDRATACFASDATFFPYVAAISKHGNPSEWDLAALLGSQGHLQKPLSFTIELLPSQPDSWD